MKKNSFILFSLVCAVMCFTNCDSKKDENAVAEQQILPWPGYQPFPSGYDYMDTVPLKRAYISGNTDTIRQHAWSLFVGIMQPAANNVGWPIWYTWPNSYDAMNIPQIYGLDASNPHALETMQGSGKKMASLINQNKLNLPIEYDTLHTPYYPIPKQVDSLYPSVVQNGSIIPGKHFLFNGDILIPTESISQEGYDWIQQNQLYDSAVMMAKYLQKVPDLTAPSTYIITKHMYWPVLASSKQKFSGIPVWDQSYFNYFYAGYAGYEKWTRLVAVDPSNTMAGQTTSVSFLHGVQTFDSTAAIGPVTDAKAVVHNISDFYYHQVTQSDWDSFDASDKAIINAASYWAYNKPFGVGDYLVTIAMHINTKEIPSWTMQSVWWTDQPNTGIYSKNRPGNLAAGPWLNYNMVEAYGIPIAPNLLPQATNPYIELVIHPQLTNCNNCHMRAGYPKANSDSVNWAGYQNPTCASLLQKLYPNTPCLTRYTRTDFQWIISDYTHRVPPGTKK